MFEVGEILGSKWGFLIFQHLPKHSKHRASASKATHVNSIWNLQDVIPKIYVSLCRG